MNYRCCSGCCRWPARAATSRARSASIGKNPSGDSRRSAAWPAGAYRLIVDTDLEDLAGNRIGQPFDIDVFDRVTERITTTATSLGFEVRSTGTDRKH